MPDVHHYTLRFDPPKDALVHSVYRLPARPRGFGLTSCNLAFTYAGFLDAPLKYYASSTGEVVSCFACIAYGP